MIFIAEIGLNHNGNFSLAYEMIRQAKLCGADIVKFQLGWKSRRNEINFIDDQIIQDLIKWCRYIDIKLMFSIFTEEALDLISKYDYFEHFKVASRTVAENIKLTKRIVAQGKETFISLGMWDGKKPPLTGHENVKYLWCVSKYPALPWDLVGFPKDFKKGFYHGYSDHTIGIDTALMAVVRGAHVIEKHFTLDKSDTTIRDHALSATPEEFRILVDIGRDIRRKVEIGI